MKIGIILETRHLEDDTTCLISTMVDCANMVVWADKTVTF
jgi:uncharacterized protein involved in oxidation of intracellular sulfur